MKQTLTEDFDIPNNERLAFIKACKEVGIKIVAEDYSKEETNFTIQYEGFPHKLFFLGNLFGRYVSNQEFDYPHLSKRS